MPVDHAFDDLFQEAERQLVICNSCRYCEGYCPVWPALELRTALAEGDLTHLSNLCHDCRDCFTACMYTAPHEFALNPPKVFAQLREETYRRYIWPRTVPGWMRGERGVLWWFLLISALVVVMSYLTTGGDIFAGTEEGSPYELIPHPLMVAMVTLPVVWSVGVVALGGLRYWRDTHGPLTHLLRVRRWLPALVQGAQLRHMRGGGEECAYPDNQPTAARRYFHLALFYGFGLCLVSTTSAALMQEFLGRYPPYPVLSVPTGSGLIGGVGMVVGGVGLAVLKRRSDPELGTDSMRRSDFNLIWALVILAGTGLVTTAVRAAVPLLYAPILVVHLAAVVVAFAIAPYTKFVHWVFRLLAIYQDHLDQETGVPERTEVKASRS